VVALVVFIVGWRRLEIGAGEVVEQNVKIMNAALYPNSLSRQR
jgi:hypothetical protein